MKINSSTLWNANKVTSLKPKGIVLSAINALLKLGTKTTNT